MGHLRKMETVVAGSIRQRFLDEFKAGFYLFRQWRLIKACQHVHHMLDASHT